MAQMQSLKALTKSSGRIATFAVRLSDGAVETYTYENKRTGQDVTAHKFETFLVGNNSQEYCKGYVKASKEECERAARRFKDGTVGPYPKSSWIPLPGHNTSIRQSNYELTFQSL